jgi:hypothetical protein
MPVDYTYGAPYYPDPNFASHGYIVTTVSAVILTPNEAPPVVPMDADQCGVGMILSELDGKIIISYIRRGGAAALSGKLAIKDEVNLPIFFLPCNNSLLDPLISIFGRSKLKILWRKQTTCFAMLCQCKSCMRATLVIEGSIHEAEKFTPVSLHRSSLLMAYRQKLSVPRMLLAWSAVIHTASFVSVFENTTQRLQIAYGYCAHL